MPNGPCPRAILAALPLSLVDGVAKTNLAAILEQHGTTTVRSL
jgi:hypothetical protein